MWLQPTDVYLPATYFQDCGRLVFVEAQCFMYSVLMHYVLVAQFDNLLVL